MRRDKIERPHWKMEKNFKVVWPELASGKPTLKEESSLKQGKH